MLFSGQKDCDLPKSALTSIHATGSFGQVPNTTNSESNGGGRLHVSSGLCEPHNIHQDQVKYNYVCQSLVKQFYSKSVF